MSQDDAPFGKLESLAILKTNPDGAGIVQAIGLLKTLAGGNRAAAIGQFELAKVKNAAKG